MLKIGFIVLIFIIINTIFKIRKLKQNKKIYFKIVEVKKQCNNCMFEFCIQECCTVYNELWRLKNELK